MPTAAQQKGCGRQVGSYSDGGHEMKRRYKYDFGLPFGFPPLFFRSSGPWSGRP